MSPAERLLLTVTSAHWLRMSSEEQAVVYDAIHEVVPPRLLLASNVGHEAQAFPFFLDQETQLGFYLVFGQRFVMGASEEEIAAARAELERRRDSDDYDAWPTLDGCLIGPPHVVDAAPFFVAESTLHDPTWAKIGVVRPLGQAMPDHTAARFAAQGWRLPAEAELELLRLVSSHCELVRLDSGLCTDDWHLDYQGAPVRALPWGTSVGVMRTLLSERGVISVGRLPARDLLEKVRPIGWKQVRPFFSLLPPELGYGTEAIAARAAEPPMRAAR